MLENEETKKKYVGRRYRDELVSTDDYVKIANELCYPTECINELMKAKSGIQCERILTKYRKRT